MKVVKWVALVFVLVVVIGGAILYFSLNGIVRRTVESQATKSLSLETQLSGANLSLFGGKVSLSGLQIASPKGYKAPQWLAVGKTNVRVNYGQLTKQPIRIAMIRIQNPELVIEQAGGKLNIQAVMDQLPPSEPTTQPAEPMKLVIDRLEVLNATVKIRPGIPGLAEEIAVPIPSIGLSNIGTGEGAENGAAIKDVVMQVVTALASKAADSDKIPPQFKQILNVNVGQLAGKLSAEFNKQSGQIGQDLQKKVGGELGKAVGDVLKQPTTQDAGKAVEEGLRGLLKSDNAEKDKGK